ncbi:MAG: phosphonate C-P lyase system protein PhnG [Klebsiella pneumoniae]|nr:phosphonate C-P lyase system protein PhnG [Klebsiella pneumoniae]
MHFDTATRQRWMSVLAHSEPQDLLARMQSLQLAPEYELIRTPETGLVQLQARMGGIGDRFFAGDAPLEALRSARIEARRAEVNASRVDFFTLVRGDNV